jgi:hypothetical protein
MGDCHEYERLDDIDAAIEHMRELGVRGPLDRCSIMAGITNDQYPPGDHISLYWGDKDADHLKDIGQKELARINNALTPLAPDNRVARQYRGCLIVPEIKEDSVFVHAGGKNCYMRRVWTVYAPTCPWIYCGDLKSAIKAIDSDKYDADRTDDLALRAISHEGAKKLREQWDNARADAAYHADLNA